jgi:type III pantothenate kinase
VPRSPLTVLDIGNTSLKVVLFGPGGRVEEASRWVFADDATAAPLEGSLRGLRPPLVAVSVNAAHLERVRRSLDEDLVVVGREIPIPLENRTSRPRETGADRLCAALAAARRAKGPAVAIGLGTAITADAVDASGAFLGGAIAPGLRASAAGLAAAAPRLPFADLDPGTPVPFPGGTTAEALRAGFLRGFAGLVDRLAGEAAAAARGGRRAPPKAFLHGGDADALGPLLRTRFSAAPHLVAEGARLAWLRAPRRD